jgi:hypothetical protein
MADTKPGDRDGDRLVRWWLGPEGLARWAKKLGE